jgi:hypothetical protein
VQGSAESERCIDVRVASNHFDGIGRRRIRSASSIQRCPDRIEIESIVRRVVVSIAPNVRTARSFGRGRGNPNVGDETGIRSMADASADADEITETRIAATAASNERGSSGCNQTLGESQFPAIRRRFVMERHCSIPVENAWLLARHVRRRAYVAPTNPERRPPWQSERFNSIRFVAP